MPVAIGSLNAPAFRRILTSIDFGARRPNGATDEFRPAAATILGNWPARLGADLGHVRRRDPTPTCPRSRSSSIGTEIPHFVELLQEAEVYVCNVTYI